MMDYKDYYNTLGISKTATEGEIKTAYRKLARRYHPDVNKDPKAEDKFKEVNEAYQVLSDPEKRKKYDQFGSEWQRYQSSGGQPGGFDWGRWQQAPQGGQPGYRTVSQEEFNDMFGGLGGFSDFFNTLFGQSGFSTGQSFSRGSRSHSEPPSRWSTRWRSPSKKPTRHETNITVRRWQKIEASIPPGVNTGPECALAAGRRGRPFPEDQSSAAQRFHP